MKKIITILVIVIAVMGAAALGMSAYMAETTKDDIAARDNGKDPVSVDGKYDCILVMGCGVWEDNKPSPMLKDRLDTAITLYRNGTAPKLLFSGDNSREEYSEPDCMLEYALEQGVDPKDIFLDFAGRSTYDSAYRARHIFGVKRTVAVTQSYHLYRTLYDCRAAGLKAVGAAADQMKYRGRVLREIREVAARDKDLIKCMRMPEAEIMGDSIDITGDGRVTHLNSD